MSFGLALSFVSVTVVNFVKFPRTPRCEDEESVRNSAVVSEVA